MLLSIKVKLTCPYCNHEQDLYLPMEHSDYISPASQKLESSNTRSGKHKPEVVMCWPDEGGCDRYYVAHLSISAGAETYAIESN